MTQQHPITPLPKLFQRWSEQFEAGRSLYAMFEDIYRAGADAELEACRMEIIDGAGIFYIDETSDRVRLTEDIWATRRPKPPSLKEQALLVLDDANLDAAHHNILLRALEQLDD